MQFTEGDFLLARIPFLTWLIPYFGCLGHFSGRKRTSLGMDASNLKLFCTVQQGLRDGMRNKRQLDGCCSSYVIHHVIHHEWACGSCNHGPLLIEEPDNYLSKLDKCMEAFCEVFLDKKLLKSLSVYVWSRHTRS